MVERVTALSNGGEIQLETSGRAVFDSILLPDASIAEAWLLEHALQRDITFTTRGEDRYGRLLITSDIEEVMLREGVAITYATRDVVPARWHEAEAKARSAKRGVWANDTLIITPEKALETTGGFYVIEGAITRIYEGKEGSYLNFGEDWHEDFSIAISSKLRRSMKAFLSTLNAGDRIRVRGTVVEENGPMIRLNHADNLEKL